MGVCVSDAVGEPGAQYRRGFYETEFALLDTREECGEQGEHKGYCEGGAGYECCFFDLGEVEGLQGEGC